MHKWALLLVVLPLMLAQMAAGTKVIDVLWSRAFIVISGVFLAYWVGVGVVFSRLDMNKVTAFLLGNSLVFLLLAVLVVGFFTPVQPWLPLWKSAHLYPLFVLPLSSHIADIFSADHISLFTVLTVGYTLVTGAFSAGFVLSVTRRKAGGDSPDRIGPKED